MIKWLMEGYMKVQRSCKKAGFKREGFKRFSNYNKILGCFILTLSIAIILSFSFFTIGTRAEEEQENQTYKYYRQIEVQYGDTLLSIAKRNYTKEYKNYNEYIKEIREINSFYSSDVTAGSFLIVPYYDNVLK